MSVDCLWIYSQANNGRNFIVNLMTIVCCSHSQDIPPPGSYEVSKSHTKSQGMPQYTYLLKLVLWDLKNIPLYLQARLNQVTLAHRAASSSPPLKDLRHLETFCLKNQMLSILVSGLLMSLLTPTTNLMYYWVSIMTLTIGPGEYESSAFMGKSKVGLICSKGERFKPFKSQVPGPGTYEVCMCMHA